MNPLTLKEANTIIDAMLAKAREMNLNPMCVAVVDAGGHLIALKREDNAPMIRPDLAIAKAWDVGCVWRQYRGHGGARQTASMVHWRARGGVVNLLGSRNLDVLNGASPPRWL